MYIYCISYLYLKISCFDKKWNFLIINKYENAYRLYIKYNRFQIRFFYYSYLTLDFIIITRQRFSLFLSDVKSLLYLFNVKFYYFYST